MIGMIFLYIVQHKKNGRNILLFPEEVRDEGTEERR